MLMVRGYGEIERDEAELAREAYYTERLARASEAAEAAAYEAHINAALAAQAHDFNRSIMVGFVGAGAVSVLMWALTQAITARKR
jgi:hypothetical protein